MKKRIPIFGNLTTAACLTAVVLLAGGCCSGLNREAMATGASSAPAMGAERVEVLILHDNDLHFHYNHADALRETITHLRETRRNVLLLNGGDIFVRHRQRWAEDSLEYYERMAAFIIDEMNETGYDAMVLGNHEIDYQGEATLRQLRRAAFPTLGANVTASTPKFFDPPSHHVFTLPDGIRVAVLGLSTGGAPGVEVGSRPAAIREFAHLRAENELFVLLTHIGVNADRRLARDFPEVDVIVGGHSHTLLPEAEWVNGVLVAQAGGHLHLPGGFIDRRRPMWLGVVQVVFEGTEIVAKRGKVFEIDTAGRERVIPAIETWLEEAAVPAEVARPD